MPNVNYFMSTERCNSMMKVPTFSHVSVRRVIGELLRVADTPPCAVGFGGVVGLEILSTFTKDCSYRF